MLPAMPNLHFTDKGQGPACLFIHAFPFDGRMWGAQRDALASEFRIIVPDLRGFGRSLGLAPASSIDDHADDLVKLLDHLHIDNVAVLGLSMGGYIALAMARRHPERLRALVLADTRAVPDFPKDRANRDINIGLVRNEGVGALMDKMRPILLAEDAHESVVALARSIGASQHPQGVIDALEALRDRPDARPGLSSISVPTSLIVGELDTLSPASEMKEMADAIPAARLTVIPGVGHLANLEAPEAFNRALRAGLC